eukprot:8227548-Pyramimonas_sp.AAC.1
MNQYCAILGPSRTVVGTCLASRTPAGSAMAGVAGSSRGHIALSNAKTGIWKTNSIGMHEHASDCMYTFICAEVL